MGSPPAAVPDLNAALRKPEGDDPELNRLPRQESGESSSPSHRDLSSSRLAEDFAGSNGWSRRVCARFEFTDPTTRAGCPMAKAISETCLIGGTSASASGTHDA